ncbi:MAG: MBOAT family O-acyltransferase [Flavobacteriales bacterium]
MMDQIFNMDNWLNLLSFNKEEPLIFTTVIFWYFFGAVLLVYSIIHKHAALRNAFLFLVSIFFYYKTSQWFFSLLLFSTISDYLIGFRIHAAQGVKRKLWLALSVTINLLILIYFKYSYFFADSFNALLGTEWHPINHFALLSNQFFGSSFDFMTIGLPVGISFYTFQTISYGIDVYRKDVEPVKSILDFGFYVSFFPQLVAGPIVRAADFIPQIYKKYHLDRFTFGMAFFWILNGLVKKLVLSDYLALNFIDRVFDSPGSYTGFENLMALYGYSLQVYADFSGYTDIAIGVAMLLGFTLPQNFNSPYKAHSVGNFWKRWHISLSTWLKDYLYIPMGGNRGGSVFSMVSLSFIVLFVFLISGSWIVLGMIILVLGLSYLLGRFVPAFKNWSTTNINVMMTMLIGGLWHGASWNFVIWGGLNGLGLVVFKLWNKVSPWANKSKWYNRAWGVFLTFQFISFTRIWFRSGSNNSWENINEPHEIMKELFTANTMLNKILKVDFSVAPEILLAFAPVFALMFIGMVIHLIPERIKVMYRQFFANAPIAAQISMGVAAIILLYQVYSADAQPFIYFQF